MLVKSLKHEYFKRYLDDHRLSIYDCLEFSLKDKSKKFIHDGIDGHDYHWGYSLTLFYALAIGSFGIFYEIRRCLKIRSLLELEGSEKRRNEEKSEMMKK